MRNERRGGAYRELENELIEESIQRFLANAKKRDSETGPYQEDPRSTTIAAEASGQGFSIQEGQYISILK